MQQPGPVDPLLQVSCAVCERLHAPSVPQASNPVCGGCTRERLPAGRLPAWFSHRRRRLTTR